MISLFFVIPALASSSSTTTQVPNGAELTGTGTQNLSLAQSSQTIIVQVQIPCAGHTGVITTAVKKLTGVISITATQWNTFKITFDSTKTTKENILNAGIFKQYPATLK